MRMLNIKLFHIVKHPIPQRIKFILDNYFNGNKSAMGAKINVNYQHINNWLTKGNAPKLESYLGLYELVRDKINPVWFLTGEGDERIENAYSEPMTAQEPKASYSTEINNLKIIIEEKERLIKSQEEVIQLLKQNSK